MVILLYPCVTLVVASVDVRLSVGRGCVSLLVNRAVSLWTWIRLCRSSVQLLVRRRVHVMVLLLSRRVSLVTVAVNGCLSVGR